MKKITVKYVQNRENKICITVSLDFPFQSAEEYPKNCINNLIDQKTPNPKTIFFPSTVESNSSEDVKHKTPIRNTTKAMKNV